MLTWISSLTPVLFFFAVLAGGPHPWVWAEENRGLPKVMEPHLRFEEQLSELVGAFWVGSLSETNLFPLIRSKELQWSLLEMADLVLKSFPPEQYDYVSLGRSGAGLSVAMEVLLEASHADAKVLEFPLSGLRQDYFEPVWYKENLKSHFQNFFTDFRSSSKKILIMDAVFHGGTLLAFAEILNMAEEESWLPSHKQVHFLGLFDPRSDEERVSRSLEEKLRQGTVAKGWTRLRLPAALSPFFFYSVFDSLAQFGSWYFRDYDYEQSALTYWSSFGESERAKGKKMPLPREPAYKKPRRIGKPGLFRKAFRLGRPTERDRLKEDLFMRLQETPRGDFSGGRASPADCAEALRLRF